MAEPTLEEVARAWAGFAAADIVEDLVDRALIGRSDEDEVRELLVEHLTDIAVANVRREPAPSAAPKVTP